MLINNLNSRKLEEVGDFLGLNLITGTNILSTLFKWTVNFPVMIVNLFAKLLRVKPYKPTHRIFNYVFKLNYGPLEYLKRKLLSF